MEEMKLEFEEVFRSVLGAIKGRKAKPNLKEGTTPKFHKARRVPYLVRLKIDAELQKLEYEGFITKVDWSEWETPVVAVPKANGLIRLCGDFKGTINPELKVDQYLLPRIEDIFANLAAGEKFTKIDLRQAYLQIEMEEESKKCLTINTYKGLYQYNILLLGVASFTLLSLKRICILQLMITSKIYGMVSTKCKGISRCIHYKNNSTG